MASSLNICLVIGGSGWTGSYIVNQLLQEAKEYDTSIEVHVMDIEVPVSREELRNLHEEIITPNGPVSIANKITYHQCDITNSEEVVDKIKEINPNCVFHTASIVDLRKFPSHLLERVNIHGTFNILKGLYDLLKSDRETYRFMVYTSSIDVVADKHGVSHANEETPYTEYPSNHYKGSKIVAETEVLRGNGDFCGHLRTCALRPSHIFGPGDVLMDTIGATVSKDNAFATAIGPPSASMSFVSASNCAYAHILAMRAMISEHEREGGQPVADWNNKVAGTATFISDFDANFCDLYQTLTSRYTGNSHSNGIPTDIASGVYYTSNGIPTDIASGVYYTRVSTWVLEIIVYIVEEIWESLIYFLFGNTNHSSSSKNAFYEFINRNIRQHPVTGITSSMAEACGQLTCVCEKAKHTIGYTISNMPPSVSTCSNVGKSISSAGSGTGAGTGAGTGRRSNRNRNTSKKMDISPVRLQTKEEAIKSTLESQKLFGYAH